MFPSEGGATVLKGRGCFRQWRIVGVVGQSIPRPPQREKTRFDGLNVFKERLGEVKPIVYLHKAGSSK